MTLTSLAKMLCNLVSVAVGPFTTLRFIPQLLCNIGELNLQHEWLIFSLALVVE